MWAPVNRYIERVDYLPGIKAAGLDADPPSIDCSGWAALPLSTGMEAVNCPVGRERFG